MEYEISNVSIEKIYRATADKNGKPYVSGKGNAFTKVDVYIDPRTIEDRGFQGKLTYFDYFGNSDNWDIGSTLTGKIVVKEGKDKNGKIIIYYNFELPPSGKKALELDIKNHEDRIKALEDEVFGKQRDKKEQEIKDALDFSKEALTEQKEDSDVDDLPF